MFQKINILHIFRFITSMVIAGSANIEERLRDKYFLQFYIFTIFVAILLENQAGEVTTELLM